MLNNAGKSYAATWPYDAQSKQSADELLNSANRPGRLETSHGSHLVERPPESATHFPSGTHPADPDAAASLAPAIKIDPPENFLTLDGRTAVTRFGGRRGKIIQAALDFAVWWSSWTVRGVVLRLLCCGSGRSIRITRKHDKVIWNRVEFALQLVRLETPDSDQSRQEDLLSSQITLNAEWARPGGRLPTIDDRYEPQDAEHLNNFTRDVTRQIIKMKARQLAKDGDDPGDCLTQREINRIAKAVAETAKRTLGALHELDDFFVDHEIATGEETERFVVEKFLEVVADQTLLACKLGEDPTEVLPQEVLDDSAERFGKELRDFRETCFGDRNLDPAYAERQQAQLKAGVNVACKNLVQTLTRAADAAIAASNAEAARKAAGTALGRRNRAAKAAAAEAAETEAARLAQEAPSVEEIAARLAEAHVEIHRTIMSSYFIKPAGGDPNAGPNAELADDFFTNADRYEREGLAMLALTTKHRPDFVAERLDRVFDNPELLRVMVAMLTALRLRGDSGYLAVAATNCIRTLSMFLHLYLPSAESFWNRLKVYSKLAQSAVNAKVDGDGKHFVRALGRTRLFDEVVLRVIGEQRAFAKARAESVPGGSPLRGNDAEMEDSARGYAKT